MGEAEVGEAEAEKGRTSTAVGLALRIGRNILAQDEGASQAVEAASLEVVKQVTYYTISAAIAPDGHPMDRPCM